MHIVARQRDNLERVIHGECVRLGSRSPYADLMPAIVVHMDAGLITHSHRTIAQIEGVVYVSIDQFHGHEIIASAAIEDQQPVGFDGLEAEINGDAGVGLEHGQTHIGVFGAESGRMIGLSSRRVDKSRCQLERGTGQGREFRSQRLDDVQIAKQVKVEV